MRTSPASLTDETSAGTRSRRRDVQIKPMKLLLCAMRTDSLMDMSVRPQFVTMFGVELGRRALAVEGATPSSLQIKIGSVCD